MDPILLKEALPVKSKQTKPKLTRRQMLAAAGKSAVMAPLIQSAILSCASAAESAVHGAAGIDRVTILPGKTYLRGWAGYGDPPQSNQNRRQPEATPNPTGPPITATWAKD